MNNYVTLVISKIIWNVYTVIKSCPYAFKGSKCLLWIKIWRFEPQNASENILQQFDHFEIYQDLYGKLLKLDCVARVVFPIQILLFFGSHCNDIQLKIYRFPNSNMLFQFLLTKFLKSELFSCHRKLITWSTKTKGLFYWFLPQVTKLPEGECGNESFVTCAVVTQKIIIII